MALTPIIDKLDGLPDALKSEYRAGTAQEGLEGRFVLDVTESNGWGLENIAGIKSAISKERADRERAESALKSFGDLKADTVRAELDELARLRAIDPGKEADKLAAAKAEHIISQATGKYEAEMKAKDDELARLQQGLRSMTESAAIDAALASADALNPEALRLKLKSHIRLKETGDAGQPYAVQVVGADGAPLIDVASGGKATDKTLAAFVADLRKDPAWAVNFRAAGKSGSGASGGGGAGDKSMSRTAFEQLSAAERMAAMKGGITVTD